jgi:hypothetical protein
LWEVLTTKLTSVDGVKAAKEVEVPFRSAGWARIGEDRWLVNNVLHTTHPLANIILVHDRLRLSGHFLWGIIKCLGSGRKSLGEIGYLEKKVAEYE